MNFILCKLYLHKAVKKLKEKNGAALYVLIMEQSPRFCQCIECYQFLCKKTKPAWFLYA